MLRFLLVLALLLAGLSYGVYSQDVTEMSEGELLLELMEILSQQETLLTQQQTQIADLKNQLQTAENQLLTASVWQTALTTQIDRLKYLLEEQKQLWQSYKEEKEREIRRLKFAVIGVSVAGAGLGALNIYQAVK